MEHDEARQIARILDGDHEAYRSLVDRYKNGLYHHCFKIVRDEDAAEDLAQEAFIEAFVHLEQYDSRYRFSTWLYKIATNGALAYLRKRRDVRMDEDEAGRIVSTLISSERLAEFAELEDAVQELPRQYRSVITMHYGQGKSYAEIAQAMGTSVGSVKGWMSRARNMLKEALS